MAGTGADGKKLDIRDEVTQTLALENVILREQLREAHEQLENFKFLTALAQQTTVPPPERAAQLIRRDENGYEQSF